MKMNRACALAASSIALLIGSTLPAWSAAPSITFTLAGKPVTSVPIDKLSELTITVNTGGQKFNQVYNGQWGGLDQAMTLKALPYTRSGSKPNLENARKWFNYDLSLTSLDSNWGGKTNLSAAMRKAAPKLEMYKATTDDDIMFTSLFYRKVHTGKTVWQDGGWVQETRWDALGENLGQASLKLDPPTFASSLDPNKLFSSAVEKFNTDTSYDLTRAQFLSRTLLYPSSYSGRTVKFDGSKITEFSQAPGSKTVYNWNYNESDGSEYITASFTINMKLHSVMQTTFESIPIPNNLQADFSCPIQISVNRKLSDSNWTVNDLEFNDSLRKTCKTADGKLADDLIKSVDPLSGATSPQDLLKNFGF